MEEIRREIKKNFSEVNKNNDITYQNLWGSMKAILRGKFMALNSYSKRTEIHQINNITFHLKALGKKE